MTQLMEYELTDTMLGPATRVGTGLVTDAYKLRMAQVGFSFKPETFVFYCRRKPVFIGFSIVINH